MTSINVDDKYCTSEKLGGGQKNNIIIWSFLIHKSSWTLYDRSLGTRSLCQRYAKHYWRANRLTIEFLKTQWFHTSYKVIYTKVERVGVRRVQ